MVCVVGLEKLKDKPQLASQWGRCGLLANQASVTKTFTPAWTVAKEVLGTRLVALFGPQHGFYGTKQDNMIETGHQRHEEFKIPLYSLYSETREPTKEMFDNLDTLIIDLQIVGCRIYTWKSTIAGCLRAAKKYNKKIVILDRPNPVGGEVIEGRVLDANCTSFVGQFPTPMRHGLTSGESALFFNKSIGADLEVVALDDWNPAHYWSDLDRPWVLTSPNLPTFDAVSVYPGTVIFEGVNFSEGRGTGLPFQFAGAPYIPSGKAFKQRIETLLGGSPPGIYLRECQFEPTSQKCMGQTCNGVQIHVLDPKKVRSLNLAIAMVRAAIELGGASFKWKDPPYEYDHTTLPIKLIFGSSETDKKFTAKQFDINDPFWHADCEQYIEQVKDILLYKRAQKVVTGAKPFLR